MTIKIYVKFKQLINWDSQLVCSIIIIILIMHYVEKVCIAVLQDNGLVPYSWAWDLAWWWVWDWQDRTFEVAKKVWVEVFFYLAENNVMFEGILLKPSMFTPGIMASNL